VLAASAPFVLAPAVLPWGPGRDAVVILVSAIAATATAVGARSHRPRGAAGWYALATCIVVASGTQAASLAGVRGGAYRSVDALATAGSLVLGVLGVALIFRARGAGAWDVGTVLDFSVLVVAAGLLVSHLVVEPSEGVPLDAARLAMLAAAAGSVGILVVVVRMLSSRAAARSTRALGLAVLFGAASALASGLQLDVVSLPATLQLAAVLCVASAAVDPSMVHISEPVARRLREFTASRVAVLVLALGVAPVTEIVDQWRGEGVDVVWAVAAVVIAVGVALRVRTLLGERDRARSEIVRRERLTGALADLGRSLVSAASVEEAVRLGAECARSAGDVADLTWSDQEGGGALVVASAGGYYVVPADSAAPPGPDVVAFVRQIADLVTIASDRIRTEERLREAQKIQAVGTLSAGLAHEINTPLQVVEADLRFVGDAFLAAADRAVDEAELAYLRGEVPRAIDDGVASIARAAGIVRAMRAIGDPGHADAVILDVSRVVDDVLTVSSHLLGGVDDVQVELAARGSARARPIELTEVLVALLANAVEELAVARPGGGGRVGVRTYDEPGAVVVEVSDNGRGIPEEHRTRVWEQFFTTKEIGTGAGLGLSVARSIVERIGGSIELATSSEGSSFRVVVPRSG